MAIEKSKQDIKELFVRALNIFTVDKKKYSEDENRPRQVSKYEFYKIIVKELPALLETQTNILKSQYILEGSIGKGNIAEVPWICVFDKEITESAEDGYYIVFLFRANMKGVYLSLNQGFTKYEREYGGKIGIEKIKANANKYQKLLGNIDDFNTNEIALNAENRNRLAKGYEAGNICSKYYPVQGFPSDDGLIESLKRLVVIYSALKKRIILDGSEIKIDEEEFQEEIQNGKLVKLQEGRIEKPEKKNSITSTAWPRSRNISFTALSNAKFKCENDESHVTFTSAKTGHQYVEAHHLIPLEFQDLIDPSIDVPENIISLCPNCHRAFHNSTSNHKSLLISKFYQSRKDILIKRGVNIEEGKLQEFYKIITTKSE